MHFLQLGLDAQAGEGAGAVTGPAVQRIPVIPGDQADGGDDLVLCLQQEQALVVQILPDGVPAGIILPPAAVAVGGAKGGTAAVKGQDLVQIARFRLTEAHRAQRLPGLQQKTVGMAGDLALLLHQLLGLQQAVKAPLHRKARELPLDDPGEPHQGAHIEKPDGGKGFLLLQKGKSGSLQMFGHRGHAPAGKRGPAAGQQQLHKLPVIVLAHLLGEKHTAGPEHPKDLLGVKGPMAVEYQVKAPVGKGKEAVRRRVPEVHTQGQQRLPAQLHIGGKMFGGGGEGRGMAQRQQKFSASGVQVQNAAVGPQGVQRLCPVVPWQVALLGVPVIDVGKIPAVDVGDGLFRQPLGFICVVFHYKCSFFLSNWPKERGLPMKGYSRRASSGRPRREVISNRMHDVPSYLLFSIAKKQSQCKKKPRKRIPGLLDG